MQGLRRTALAALVVVCALAAAPVLYAEGADPTPGGVAVFDVGGWVRGWLEWLGALFTSEERGQRPSIEAGSTNGGPPTRADGDGSGCADPWGNPVPCRP
ncbi:MAG: hypothetical protein ACRDHY_11875 [Anaerolineales bacterium]